ncbi:MAG: V-type ATPase subunit [Bacillota bacterium]
MASLTGNAIIAKTKSIYGDRLKENDYEYLLKAQTVSEIVSYLKTKANYQDYLEGIEEHNVHRGQLEEILKKAWFGHTVKIVKFVDSKDTKFYELNMVRREIDVILTVLRSVISKDKETSFAKYPHFFTRHASFDLFKLSESKTFQDILEALKDTRYFEILKPFNVRNVEDISYGKVEHQLDILYYDEVFKRIDSIYKGKEKRDIKTIFQTKIDLENIIKIYRFKKFYNTDEEDIREALILNHSEMSKKAWDDAIRLPEADLVLYYLERYGKKFHVDLPNNIENIEDNKEYLYIENIAEKIKYKMAKQYMYFSSSAAKVYSAFLILSEIERTNLNNLIEGIRYELNEDDIKEILIY